eukprot:3905741-Rhodomonas_salina.1
MAGREENTTRVDDTETPEAAAGLDTQPKYIDSADAAGGPAGSGAAEKDVCGAGEGAAGGCTERQDASSAQRGPDGGPGTKPSRLFEVSGPAAGRGHGPFTVEQLVAARQEAVFSYDTTRYPFEGHMRRLCGLGADDVELNMLHMLAQSFPERPPLSMAMMHGFKVAGWKLPKKWNKALGYKRDRLKRFLDSRAFKDFQE